jgi:PAS domain S-box-containing protein
LHHDLREEMLMKIDHTPRTILLVEDEAIIALAQEQTLQQYGYSVVKAMSGEEAIEIATADPSIDLILMDIDLGYGIDGTEAAGRILATREIPIVFLTGHAEKEMVDRVKGITRYGYVLKSAGEFVLMESISMAFELFDAHRKLAQSRDHYRSVVRLTGDIVVQHAADGRWVFVNGTACEFWGRPCEALLAEGYMSFVHPDDREATESALEHMKTATESVWGVVNRQWTPSGWRTVEWNSAPILNERGEFEGWQSTGRDITGRKTTEQLLRAYRQAADGTDDMIVAVDTTGSYIYANRSFYETHGLRPQDVIGRQAGEVLGEGLYEREVRDRLRRCLAGESVSFEMSDTYPNLGRRYLSVTYSPIRNADEITGAIGIVKDITAYKQNEQRLSRQLARSHLLEELAEAALSGTAIPDLVSRTTKQLGRHFNELRVAYSTLDENGQLTVVSSVQPHAMPDISGMDADLTAAPTYLHELRGRDPVVVTDVTSDDRVGPLRDPLDRGRTGAFVDVPLVHSERLVGLLCLDSPTAREWSDDEIATVRDVAEYLSLALKARTAQQELEHQSRELLDQRWRLQNIIESTNIGTWEWNVQTGDTSFNETWAEMVGYTLEELSPISVQTWYDLVHPDDLGRSERLLDQHFAGVTPRYDIELRMRHKNGYWIWVHDRGKVVTRTQDGDPLLVFGTHTDITERKQAEQALQESEQKHRLLAENSVDVIYALDSKLRPTYLSPSSEDVLGYTTDASETRTVFDLVHPDDVGRVRGQVAKSVARKDVSGSIEFRVLTPDGDLRWVENRARFVYDYAGSLERVVGTVRDITERKTAEESLRRHAATLDLLGKNATDAIIQVDADLHAVYVSPSSQHVLGYSLEDFASRSVLDVVYPEDRPLVEKALAEAVTTGSSSLSLEYRVYAKDERLRWVETRARLLYDDNGRFAGGVYRQTDVTERVEADAEVRRLLAEKETLLKEVHHRIKNNMNTLRALLRLQAQSASRRETSEALEDAERRIHSMSLLYDKLSESEATSAIPLSAYLNPLVDEIVSLFPNRSNVTVLKEIGDATVSSKSLSALGTIINELLTNAMKYAFPDGSPGTLRVAASTRHGRLLVEVSDDGVGLPEDAEPDEDSGHGLNLVKLLAEQLNGSVTIESNEGTRFLLDLRP